MKQVNRRTLLVLLLVLALGAGMVFFCVEYVAQGRSWAAFSANEHNYTDGRLSTGRILDCYGEVLYDADLNAYSENWLTRVSTLHLVGDQHNNISTSAKATRQDELVGFHPLTGTTTGGNQIYLTIDSDLNELAYGYLAGYKGTVAIYNYQTGEVLCMVSTPAFDPMYVTEVADGDRSMEGAYLNRALSATFTPGSVFKVVTAAAALENIPNVKDRTFTCTGSVQIGDDTITCPEVHGEMDFYGAFAHSCNCAFAELAVELGADTIEEYAQKAGLLESLTFSGVATAAGSYEKSDKSWEVGWSGVGQYNDLICPGNMMVLMGAIANDGRAVIPRFIHRETTKAGLPLISEGKTRGETTFDKDTCRTLQEMLANNTATVYGDMFGGLPVCAKSGTAEVGSYVQPHSWFAGYLDDADHPLAFVAMVENGGSGQGTAGYIISQVLQRAVQNMDEK